MALSIVRRNMMERPGYTPYCGNTTCRFGMPRTFFDGQQFECSCGWRSGFEAEFIEQYKQRNLSSRSSGCKRAGGVCGCTSTDNCPIQNETDDLSNAHKEEP